MDIFDLPGWRLLEAQLDGDGYRLFAEFLAEPDTCQRCGVIVRLYRHGTHQLFKAFLQGLHVVIKPAKRFGGLAIDD